jgi:DNA-binding phage protein
MNVKLKTAILQRFRYQTDFAKEAGISEVRLSQIIRERREPTTLEVEKIIRTLGMKPKELDLARTHK